MGVSMSTARRWVERWELQQQRYAVDRETRFTVITDVVQNVVQEAVQDVVEDVVEDRAENAAGDPACGVAGDPAHDAAGERGRPLLLDLGCGPGSLAARLAARLPHAEIVAVDMDPLLLELGRTHRPDAARYVDAVIGAEGWTDALALDRPLDAAVSTTALHYLPEAALLAVYRELARRIRPGGVLVNGDHFPADDPWRGRLATALGRRFAERSRTGGHDDWESWWRGAAREQEFAGLLELRERRRAALGGSAGEGNGLGAARHAALLRRAGFARAGLVWQYGDSGVLVARKE
ncbi:class I SAM-dependent methyltransferase [Streptomyces abyssomicinicus]|uniref:class I SAM-dependent methyltransferase n=1 Tax=Streptomyces abyssomicinicus TaxID=574929 RepID=UPI001250AB30|nr:class I SAM-dependent methyltransferase [Streptomyces abyssomicinicus]